MVKYCHAIALIGLLLALLAACSTVPHTSLPSAIPQGMPSGDGLSELEKLLVLGNPASLAAAVGEEAPVELAADDQRRVYIWLGYELAKLAYPELTDSTQGFREISQNDALVRLFLDARNGRSPDPAYRPADALEALLCSLTFFRFRTLESAQRSLAMLQQFDAYGERSSLAELVRGMALERSGDSASAMVAYRKAIEIGSDNYQAQLALSNMLSAQGSHTEALEVLDQVDLLLVRTLAYRKTRALVLYGLARYSEADPLVTGVLLEEPSNAVFMLMRSHILVERKEYRQAQPLLEAYSKIDATQKLYLTLRARIALDYNKDRRNALIFLRRGIERYPEDNELMLYTARVLGNGGTAAEQEEAVRLARTVLERDPESHEALRLILLTETRSGSFEAAAELADRLVARGLQPTDYPIVCEAYRNAGLGEAALTTVRNWLSFEPDNEAARIAHIGVLLDLGRLAELGTLLPLYKAHKGGASYRSALFWAQASLSTDTEQVLSALRSALVEDSMNVDALVAMYDYYVRIQDYQRAVFYLKQAAALAPNRLGVNKRKATMNNLGFAIP